MRETNRPTHKDTHIKERKQVEYSHQGLARALLKVSKQWKLPNYTNRSIWHHQRQTSAQQALLLYKKSGVFSSLTIKTNCLNRQCRKCWELIAFISLYQSTQSWLQGGQNLPSTRLFKLLYKPSKNNFTFLLLVGDRPPAATVQQKQMFDWDHI